MHWYTGTLVHGTLSQAGGREGETQGEGKRGETLREHGSVNSSGPVRGSPCSGSAFISLADITGGRGEADKWGQVRWERAARLVDKVSLLFCWVVHLDTISGISG